MHLTYPLPWWLAVVLALAIAGLVLLEYRRPIVPIGIWTRALLASCRAAALAALVLLPFRPFVLVAPRNGGTLVPVLIDVSRSMRIADAQGAGERVRLSQARAVVKDQLLPTLSRSFAPQLYAMADRVSPTTLERLETGGRGSDLGGALAAVRDRHRGQDIAGIVLLSDGGDTGGRLADAALAEMPPVFAVGIGSPDAPRDRELVDIVAGEQKLDQAAIDLKVSVHSSGFGRAPFSLRLLANGRQLEERRVVLPTDGATIDEVFTVSPDPALPTVYRAEIPPGDGEAVLENNARSVRVNPAGRKRRLLVMAGAPGFEHTFMMRAWGRDPGLEVDAVVRKGRNADGQETFFVQTAPGRTLSLTRGFPSRREDLYAYDGLVIDNAEGDAFTRDELGIVADFVGERGGGLLVVGSRSFSEHGLAGTPLENVLPVQLTDRRGASRAPSNAVLPLSHKVVLTPAGERHPALRIGASVEQTRRMWTDLPALASTTPLGSPRSGATVLAVAAGQTGDAYPVIAAQQYGRGRSMAFSGEAAWRWRMLLPASDRSYEYVWRQAARWLTSSSPDSFTLMVPERAAVGEATTLTTEARDAVFSPVGDVDVDVRVTAPDGETSTLKPRPVSGVAGRSTADLTAEQEGLYRVTAEARRGGVSIGSVSRWMYVGGLDREFVDPRLNEPLLRRVARASGGRYLRPADAGQIAAWLKDAARADVAPERRDLWHEPWVFMVVVAALLTEWIVRRRAGLR
jgi:uncharacterized membrane protein